MRAGSASVMPEIVDLILFNKQDRVPVGYPVSFIEATRFELATSIGPNAETLFLPLPVLC